MVFGAGYAAADDVVAHELTHGVTEYMSNLIYDGQSGAINESLSDTFGEFVDLTNTGGTDNPAARWLLGEDVPGSGAIRDMANPPAFGDPDRMGSPLYYRGIGDNGGVHSNSGVGNKFAYLLADGGTFNGRTVTGVGLAKAPLIIYWAANLLTESSDYETYGQALLASCASLVGSDGITLDDCVQVEQAGRAVEIIPTLTAPEAPTTPAGLPGTRQASVAWVTPPDGKSAISDYVVQFSSNGGSSWATFPDGVSTTTAATVTGLTNGVGYRFRVAAVNAIGTSDFSPPSTEVTPGASIPSSYVASYVGAPVVVPDGDSTGVTVPIAVPVGIGPITKITTTLNRIDMTYDRDLGISLISPSGTEVVLSSNNGDSGDNYVETVLDDNAPVPITAGSAPFTGVFRPQESLATLIGETSSGTWKLRVADTSTHDLATVSSWSLALAGPTPQVITFPQPADTPLSAGTLTASATATSGLPVTFVSTTPAVCTVEGTSVALRAVGPCTINADQSGNSVWAPAPQVTRTFQVTGVAPANTVAPVVSGTSTFGQLLSTTPGTWTGTPAPTVSYQWQSCTTSDCVGGTVAGIGTGEDTCVLTQAEVGKYIRVEVTATNGTAPDAVAYTNISIAVTPAPPGPSVNLVATPGNGSASIAFTAPASTGGAEISNYTYSTDDGATWVTRSPASAASPVEITGLVNGTTYQVKLRAVNAAGDGAESEPVAVTPVAPTPADALVFVPVDPARVFDSRSGQRGTGPVVPSLPDGSNARVVSVAATQAGGLPVVPAGAAAIVYNLTVPGPGAAGHVRVMPADAALTSASAINFRPGETIANGLTVKTDPSRQIKLYNGASVPVEAIVDVVGYFLPAGSATPSQVAGGKFTPVTPARVYDTNTSAGSAAPGETRVVSVASKVPSGASSVAYNITVVRPDGPGHLRVFPGDQVSSSASTINWQNPGEVIANGLTVRLDSDRQLKVYNSAAVPVQFLVDVVGYYSASGAYFHAANPARVFDSRVSQGGTGPVAPTAEGASSARIVPIGRTQAPPNAEQVPAGATAIAYNLTVTNTGAAGHLRVYPSDAPLVSASTINWPGPGYSRANGTVVGIPASHDVALYNGSSAATDTIIDTLGYYQ